MEIVNNNNNIFQKEFEDIFLLHKLTVSIFYYYVISEIALHKGVQLKIIWKMSTFLLSNVYLRNH